MDFHSLRSPLIITREGMRETNDQERDQRAAAAGRHLRRGELGRGGGAAAIEGRNCSTHRITVPSPRADPFPPSPFMGWSNRANPFPYR